MTLSINAYLLEEQSCQISSWSKLKWQSLTRRRTMRTIRWVAIWDHFLI